MMMPVPELERYDLVCQLLGSNIPQANVGNIPNEVADALFMARQQMQNLPAIIEEVKAAHREFDRLTEALGQILALAEQAARLPENDQDSRHRLEAEFIRHARVVAEIAGRENYQRPEISIATRAQAQATMKIMVKLEPVKNLMAEQLLEHSQLIDEAIEETLVFLETVRQAYAQSEIGPQISDLLQRVSGIRQDSFQETRTGERPVAGLH